MAFSVSGYVLEKPRVGASNSAFTVTPDNMISDPTSFGTNYPTSETAPRTDYLVFVVREGDLHEASFAWTKNEVVQRFDYSSQDGRFVTLSGAAPTVVGNISPTVNSTRIKVLPPVIPAAEYPLRVSLTATGVGVPLTVTTVAQDSGFTAPGSMPALSCQISRATGAMNFSADVLTTYNGQPIRYQRQSFFAPRESNGRIGVVGDFLMLNPIPGLGAGSAYQVPLLRIGFATHMTAISVATDAAFGADPPVGSFKWSAETGAVRFNPADVTTHAGKPVYFDGVAFGYKVQMPRDAAGTVGTISTPLSLTNMPPAGGDLIFRIPTLGIQFPETVRVEVGAFDPVGKKGQVQTDKLGNVRFSEADKALYGSEQFEVIRGDLPIDHGTALRLFRTPVDPGATDSSKNDVTAVHTTADAILADPIIESPLVFLPAVPRDDGTMVVKVAQGTGSFTSTNLPRLDGVSPPSGIGYTIDFDKRQLQYAARRNNQLIPLTEPAGAVQLPEPLVLASNLVLEVETGTSTGTYTPLVLGSDALLDAVSGVVQFTTKYGTKIVTSTASSGSGSTLTDTSVNFGTLGVISGDFVNVLTGPSPGIYPITGVAPTALTLGVAFPTAGTSIAYEVLRNADILADRFFAPLKTADPATVVTRIRGSVSTVLEEGKDYIVKPTFGLIQTTERLLAGDELQVTYKSADGASPEIVTERATFLIRKEQTAAHPTPTTVLTFNAAGREIAAKPAPSVFRGGRPQVLGKTCNVDLALSTIRFVDDGTITDAIPHGPTVKPEERVTIDYYVYAALGGENTTTILRPPMAFAQINIVDGATSFTLPNNRTSDLAVGRLLRFENEEVYRIMISTYDGASNLTTVTVNAAFRTAAVNPKLYVSSGPCPTLSYFTVEAAPFQAVARGMNRVKLTGDRSTAYFAGVVIDFGGDLYLVSGSTFDSVENVTTLTLAAPVAREYLPSSTTLRRSVRPIYEVGTKALTTSKPPILTQPHIVYRVQGSLPGKVLARSTDYSIDESGRVVLTQPLLANEEVSAFYTGYRILPAGPRIRTSYTAAIAPSTSNGLVGQILKADYRVYSPDTFYYRVESLTNFKGEVANQYEQDAKSTVPTAGPNLSNGSSPKLYEQGRESIYFREGRLANEDVIARAMLKFYNDNVNLLEDVLANMDGRVVGDTDGRFKYDGSITNPVRTTFAAVTNQIDDQLKVSDAPFAFTFPPLVRTSIGTFKAAYEPSPFSRFYPTSRTRFTITTGGIDTSAKESEPIADIGSKGIRSVSNIRRRIPRARIMQSVPAGSMALTVDNATGSSTLLRPAFQVGMKVIITGSDGTPYVVDGAPATVTSVGATTLGISALLVAVPAGATVYLAPSDTTYSPFALFVGVDIGLDPDNGQLTYSSGPVSSGTVSSGMFLNMDVLVSPQDTAPERVPALFGSTTNDDGDVAVPMIGPSFDREQTYLATEQVQLTTFAASGTAPFVGTGSLDLTKTVISKSGGPFPSPVPQVNDLVRITSGLNGSTSFHRISAVTASTVTVATPFTSVDSGFSFTVAVTNNPAFGGCTFPVGTVLQDLTANFVTAGVKVGHTVIVTSGAAVGQRRQVTSVTATTLGLSSAFTSAAPTTYRVSTSLATFNAGLPSYTPMLAILRDNDPLVTSGKITSEKLALERFLDAVFTDVVPSQAGSVSGTTLTGTTTFQTLGVNSGHYVYIRSGGSGGIYPITAVPSETSITVGTAFPVAGAVTFRVVSAYSVGKVALNDCYCVLKNVDAFIADTVTQQTATANVVVTGDAGAYANGLTSARITARQTSITNRIASLSSSSGPIPKVESVLSSGDKLYDHRFTWIEHRVHLESGLVVKRVREVTQRIKNLAAQTKAITKFAAIAPKPIVLTPAESTYSSTCT